MIPAGRIRTLFQHDRRFDGLSYNQRYQTITKRFISHEVYHAGWFVTTKRTAEGGVPTLGLSPPPVRPPSPKRSLGESTSFGLPLRQARGYDTVGPFSDVRRTLMPPSTGTWALMLHSAIGSSVR
jgi:hypothetical protein